MAFPLLNLLPTILKTVGKVVGLNVFNDAADALTKAQLTPEQELALQDSLQRHEAAMKQLSADELKTAVSESLAMIASPDKFVSRARPMGLYAAYAVTAALAVALITGAKIDSSAILTLLGPMFGAASVYVWRRTDEKLNGSGNNG